jgi:hypothetical protein
MKPAVTTDSDLYDLLQKLFGLGSWDPDSDVPWWKARQHEVTKIKRSRTARNVALEDLALAARYAKAHGEQVKAVTWLYKLISPAIRWDNERRRAVVLAEVSDLIDEAIAIEAEQPESQWLTRLARARGPHRKVVYDAWLQHRDSLPSSRSDQSASGFPTASSA